MAMSEKRPEKGALVQDDASSLPVNFKSVMGAYKALDGYVYQTPVIRSHALTHLTGHRRIYFKCENLQRTGSYHLRGYMYKVISTKEKELGVNNFITHTMANGGAALACAAKKFQSCAHLVIPQYTAESIKDSIEYHKGKYYTCNPTPKDRNEVLESLMHKYNKAEGSKRHHAVFVHPYDDDDILAGYGTVGIELMLQLNRKVDCIVTSAGGGAFVSGVAIAVKGMKPHIAVFAAIPERTKSTADVFKRSNIPSFSKGGDIIKIDTDAVAVANANATQSPDSTKTCHLLTKKNMEYMEKYVNGIVRVSEKDIRFAFHYIYARCKLVVDWNAATAVAALISQPPELKKYERVAVVLSGGNVDLGKLPNFVKGKL